MSARINFRPPITPKKHVFFLPSAPIEVLRIFEKKHSILVDKKNIPKKKTSSFFQLCFFCLFFSSPSLTLFKIGQFYFILSLLLTFPEIFPMFFLFGRPY